MVIDSCTFNQLLEGVDAIGKEFEALIQRSEKDGCMFEQCVGYNELVNIRNKLIDILKTTDELDNESEQTVIQDRADFILNEIDSALHFKQFVSEK